MADMRRFDFDRVVIDGALSRMSSASPAVSQSMILATGAAYSANVATLVQKTAFVVDLINLPLTDGEDIRRLLPLEKGVWWTDGEGQLHELNGLTSLAKEIRFDGMEQCRQLYVAGALVDGFLEKVRKNKNLRQTEIVVRDFTKIFVTPLQFRTFLKSGGSIHVLQKSQLLAITVNPTSPSGYVLDSDMLCGKLTEVTGIPAYDLLKDRKKCN